MSEPETTDWQVYIQETLDELIVAINEGRGAEYLAELHEAILNMAELADEALEADEEAYGQYQG